MSQWPIGKLLILKRNVLEYYTAGYVGPNGSDRGPKDWAEEDLPVYFHYPEILNSIKI